MFVYRVMSQGAEVDNIWIVPNSADVLRTENVAINREIRFRSCPFSSCRTKCYANECIILVSMLLRGWMIEALHIQCFGLGATVKGLGGFETSSIVLSLAPSFLGASRDFSMAQFFNYEKLW